MKKDKINKYWIPLWIDKWLFGSTRIELSPDERSVWIDLLALASKNDGYVRANENVPYINSQLAGLLVISEDLLIKTIEKCIQYDKIIKQDNGTLSIKNWHEYQFSTRHKRRVSSKTDTMSKKADTIEENRREQNRKEQKIKDKRNPGIQEIIDYAKIKGFGIQGSEKVNRRYAYNLLRKKDPDGNPLGMERLKKLIDYAVTTQGEPFAPNINDFQALFYKWQDLLNFMEKKKNGGRIG